MTQKHFTFGRFPLIVAQWPNATKKNSKEKANKVRSACGLTAKEKPTSTGANSLGGTETMPALKLMLKPKAQCFSRVFRCEASWWSYLAAQFGHCSTGWRKTLNLAFNGASGAALPPIHLYS